MKLSNPTPPARAKKTPQRKHHFLATPLCKTERNLAKKFPLKKVEIEQHQPDEPKPLRKNATSPKPANFCKFNPEKKEPKKRVFHLSLQKNESLCF